MAHGDHKPDLGQPEGIAELDLSGKVPFSQLDVGTTVDKLIRLVDVGGGTPGLPAVSAVLLTGVQADNGRLRAALYAGYL